jgi:hypothetical protein
MRCPRPRLAAELAVASSLAWGLGGCDEGGKSPALSRAEEVVRSAPVPPENAPRLGVISEAAHVREATDVRAASLGLLHAGARLPRSAEPVSRAGCRGGWYAVRPRGFVCVGAEATLDENHPTLLAMALTPQRDEALPYTYGRTRSETPLFERDGSAPDLVREVGKLPRRSGMAVVGSWSAREPSAIENRFALLTSGRFVRASALEAARPSEFEGVELGASAALPLAFVVKRGVRTFRLEGGEVEKGSLLGYHTRVTLSGRFRSLGAVKYWAVVPGAGTQGDELWVRHQDVTVVQKRTAFPDFVREGSRWLDISVVTGTLVAYEGKTPRFATLLSVARELSAESSDTQRASDGPTPLPLGAHRVIQKHLTFSGESKLSFGEPFEVHDAPWALELSSGQLLHGAYWHDRFGIEHGAGNFSLSPKDAARIFRFALPELPPGWHAVAAADTGATVVVVRR